MLPCVAVKLRHMNSLKTELDAETAQQLELAERELKAALIFARFSSTSYSTGNLQHATDARSKANAVCARAAQRLSAPEVVQVSPDSVKLIWTEVQNALADLTGPRVGAKVRTAGS
jgi:hypothetical protein